MFFICNYLLYLPVFVLQAWECVDPDFFVYCCSVCAAVNIRQQLEPKGLGDECLPHGQLAKKKVKRTQGLRISEEGRPTRSSLGG